ncbi:carbamoyltransferase C-terminal domain-containing protein [Nocardia sp. 2YAB30]|uniref:carbamoyltransferase C-terminal domain-containing protein n=1 Tax=unclassified Nocardia TaxID=2637762 RepID=UPI003F9438A2
MNDGLYLSTFFDIGPLKNLQRIKLRHDHGAALWELADGQLTLRRYWEFERLSGIKQHAHALYDVDAARRLLQHLLAEEGAGLDDVVEIWGTPGIETTTAYQDTFGSGFAFHGMAHLMTAIFCQTTDPFGSPVVAMSLDAGPDCLFEPDAYGRHYYPGCVIDERGLRMFPCESPGRLWSYASKKYGLREGALMALASASDSTVELDVAEFDQTSLLDLSARASARSIVDEIDARVHAARSRGLSANNGADGRLSERDHHVSAVTKIVSELSLRVVARNLERAEHEYGADFGRSRLALAGGFALNCPTNSRLLAEYPFMDYQIPPCTSDSGIALGTGLAAFYPTLRSGDVATRFDSAYYGQEPGDVAAELKAVESLVESVEDVTARQVAALLATEGIVAWVNGPAEIGPRALGNRSLLADPRSLEVKDRLNVIKQRQWWRPVAPLVLDEHGDDYFESYRHSPFMLLNFRATDLAYRTIPGVLHLDRSARVQSVDSRTNPALAEVLTAFKRRTSIPVLGNTSLNDAGEPIANRLSEALHFAAGKGIRSLVVNASTLVRLRDAQADYSGPLPRLRSFFDPPSDADPNSVLGVENPLGLTCHELTYFFDNPATFRGVDVRRSRDAALIREKTACYLRANPGALDRGSS